MNTRLNPAIDGGRYYVLTKLKECNQQVIDTYIKGKNKTAKLLDYGCGEAPYRRLYEPHVKEYLCADFKHNPLAQIEINPQGLLPLKEKSIDLVLSTQVLEHVPQVEAYLGEARRILKVEGMLILSTHGFWMDHPDPEDYWRWTKAGLKKTIEDNGFMVLEMMGVVGLAASGLQLFQDGFQKHLPKLLRKPFFYKIQLLQRVVDSGLLTQSDASVYLVVAKKQNK
jgi:SAM-dependent methyltransferase